jgi:hypothetical protein
MGQLSQGKTFKVKVPASSTVGSLKTTLEKSSGHAAGRQRLIYGGRQLSDDNQSLMDAKVKPNTVVHLFVRPVANNASSPARQGAEGAGLLPDTSETVAVGGSRGAQLAAVTMPHGTTGNDGGNGGGAVAMEMSFSGDTDLQEYRARVKVLASLLLIVSVMNRCACCACDKCEDNPRYFSLFVYAFTFFAQLFFMVPLELLVCRFCN